MPFIPPLLRHQFPHSNYLFRMFRSNAVGNRIARLSGGIVTLIGCLVLIGWSLDLPLLKSVIPGAATMKANTALCFVLAGMSLLAQAQTRPSRLAAQIARGCAIAVLIIGALTLSQYLFGWNLGIDQLLNPDLPISPLTLYPGRMGENTALNFVLTGLALGLIRQKTRRSDSVMQTATLIMIAIALLAVVGHFYGVRVFYEFIVYSTSMATHTALTFLVLGAGILSAQSERGLMQALTGDLTGSWVARRLLPTAIALPFVTGWLILQGLRAGAYDPALSIALFSVIVIYISVFFVLINVQRLNQIDYDRRRSSDRLRSTEERLELAQVAANITTWEWDTSTGKLIWSEQAYALFGFLSDAPALFDTWRSRVHPDDDDAIQTAIQHCLATGSAEMEYRINHPERGVRWILSRGGLASNNSSVIRGIALDITDRKQSEAEIRRLNRELDRRVHELQTILDAVPVGIAIAEDAACQSISANGFAQSMLAVPADANVSATGAQAKTLPYRQLRNGKEIPGEDLPMQQAARQGAAVRNVEIQMVRSDGASFDWLVNAVPLFDEQGDVRGCVAAFMDVTVLKQAQRNEQFLNDLDRRLRQYSSSHEMAREVVDSLGEYLNVDRAAWSEIDVTAELAIVVRDWYEQPDMPSVVGTYQLSDFYTPNLLQLYKTGQPVVVSNVSTDPYTAPFLENYIPYNVNAFAAVPCMIAGTWVAILSVACRTARNWRPDEVALLQETVARCWSAIEQTRAVQALREQEERTRLATEAAEMGMWFWDLPQDDLVWTDRCKALFGLAPTLQMTYEVFLNALHPDDRDRTHAAVTRALEQKVEYNIEYRTVWSDGSIHWIAAKGKCFYDADEQPMRMMGTAQDISDRKQAELTLAAQTEELLRTNRLKDEFLAALSHELRTPLNPILGWTAMMKARRLTPAKTTEALETIDRNVRQQIRLVDDLLEVSQVVRGKLKLELRPSDLALALQNAINTVQFAATVKGIALQRHGLPFLTLIADCDRLQQVFWNLLSNAIKFTPDGGQVNVELSVIEEPNRYAQVQITDTGVGIEPEFLPYVFDRFRQADGSNTRSYGGLGLGLAIVRHLVELHGGSTTVQSLGVGRGATFTIKLPIRTEDEIPSDAIISQ
jgi:PAS domain S-box-containing protein